MTKKGGWYTDLFMNARLNIWSQYHLTYLPISIDLLQTNVFICSKKIDTNIFLIYIMFLFFKTVDARTPKKLFDSNFSYRIT